MTKFCPGCGKDRHVEEFWRHKTKKDGRQSTCIECNGTNRRANKGEPADNGVMKHNCFGLAKTPGYTKVKVRCWNADEGCKGDRDFTIEEGDSIPRFVCDTCKEVGYTRGGGMLTYNDKGNVISLLLRREARMENVVILTPRSKGFAAVARTVTHISQIKGGSIKMPFKDWK